MTRVVFLGTSAFGGDVLRRLVHEPQIDIVAVGRKTGNARIYWNQGK